MRALVNVVFVGRGADRRAAVLARAAFLAGHDVKEVAGPGVASVRYGGEVLSPLVPRGEADYLVGASTGEIDAARPLLREGAVVVGPQVAGGEEGLLEALATPPRPAGGGVARGARKAVNSGWTPAPSSGSSPGRGAAIAPCRPARVA